ncbi:VOC family protein [Nannocystis punicea]|uniref:VOC family protein n=1 Tax=Nannocystis punicea TaxID=2995304 RepID=A0ABY7HBW8_9BACT|nr:VOC family protein [Nannocystis poenicansa]WAS96757.1 VOC family protein [Nannocystis poenicansa]
MKSTPTGWPRISSSIFYDDPAAAIDWLCRAFGFEVRLKVEGEDGDIVHSELVFGEGLVMVGGTRARDPERESYQKHHVSPRSVGGGNTQTLCVFVDDVDAHCAHARASGARVFREPTTSDYGEEYWSDRSYGALDPEGHQWWFMQRIRDPRPRGS